MVNSCVAVKWGFAYIEDEIWLRLCFLIWSSEKLCSQLRGVWALTTPAPSTDIDKYNIHQQLSGSKWEGGV